MDPTQPMVAYYGMNKAELAAVAHIISQFEKRIKELETAIKESSSWLEKEQLRQSLKTNQKLLEGAKEAFWAGSL